MKAGEATEQPHKDWYSSRFVDRGCAVGDLHYTDYSALIVGMKLNLIFLIERRGIL